MKWITPTLHTVIDYLFGAFLGASPWLFSLPRPAEEVAVVFAAIYVAISALSNTPAALVPAIPFRIHGILEVPGALFLIAAPWLYGFAGDGRSMMLFVGSGMAVLAVFAATDWVEMPNPATAARA